MTAALEVGEWSVAPTRPHFTSRGKTRYPFYRRLGGPQGRSGRAENFVPSTGIRSRTVQHVVSRYTDWATGPIVLLWYCTLNRTGCPLPKTRKKRGQQTSFISPKFCYTISSSRTAGCCKFRMSELEYFVKYHRVVTRFSYLLWV